MLELESINVFYGRVHVLWDLSFRIYAGEIATILGSNGAGKTTTVKSITGLLRPRTGGIRFFGEEIGGVAPYEIVRRGITLVPEGNASFSKMLVRENLTLGAYTKSDKGEVEETLEWVYTLFPRLREREGQQAGTLSGGEQKMLAVGKALMSKPKLLILDEPSLGLAPKMVSTIFDIIRRLRADEVTILLVEQNVHHALEISDRAYVLEKGEMILEGESRKLLRNEYVKKSYLGV